ncbi:elongation factor P--(R)-beta-lysine ligase [Thalassotalea sp. M1531]|uniref:Elongation factor P--(R)-beta-lysine ligase n=1 Tax=Thalassotalea algicola TaxID=2716224 RepID=A0A7Y0LG22_9GAMM|nr:elongation factor P--(R)-beta-lysine ligase [Thalassotalea algicola]NMP33592.1 elongation factor P--(R)-beta-lysine ligase [Thalassotalea algicola]
MSWQPSMDWEAAKKRAKLLSTIRRFFEERDVVEVETPLLSQATVTDVHLDAIQAKYSWSAEGEQQLYLQTSPEFAMKRLLAAGYQSIYQISKAFRDEAQGRLHNPEFTMLEWYRIGFTMEMLMDEVQDLICLVLGISKTETLSYQASFIRYTQLDPLEVKIDDCLTFIRCHGKLEPWLEEVNDLDTLLQFIFCEFVEVNIGKEIPCFIHSFPASQASLAEICGNDSRVALRFECYFKGVELVNGFYELTDSKQQKTRFEQDNSSRNAKGLPSREVDHRFIKALESGLPKCAGVALGIDRLIMLALEQNTIANIMTYTIDKA